MKREMINKTLLIIVWLCLGLVNIASSKQHEYYVSVTNVEYAEKQQSIQIISQIFIDDFEALIKKRYNDEVVLAIDNELETVDFYMERYLKKKLQLSINGKEVQFKFLGKQYQDDIAFCYLEIEEIPLINTITIVNDILFDLYDDQENIVRTKINNKNRSFILTNAKNKAVLNFN